ncbi:1090_t:CDS:2, partial [Racocetra fulgida]
MTRKQNRICESCGYIYSTPQKLHQYYNSNKNPCHNQDLPNQNPTLLANSEIEFLNALRLFNPSEIAKTILSPKAEREYLEVLRILEPIPQFHQTDIISSGCKLLDDHYKRLFDDKIEEDNSEIDYKESEKKLIPIRIASKSKVHNRFNHKEGNYQPRKLIRLLLITGNDSETEEPSQHYCLIQGRDRLGKLAGYTTKHNRRLYVYDYCVSHQTHDPKIDAQHMKDYTPFTCIADAETLSTLIEKNQGSKTTAIQEHKVISFDYIIRRSDGKTKAPVKIREAPAGEFIKASHIIRNSAKKLIKILQSGIIPEEIAEDYIISINIFQSWEL